MVLCAECHDRVHADQLKLGTIRMTSDGPVRDIQVASLSPAPAPAPIATPASTSALAPLKEIASLKKGKWTDEDLELAANTLKQYYLLSLKSIRAMLSSKYGLEMSESVLGKIRREL